MEPHIYERMAEIDGSHWWFVARRKIIATLIEAHAPAKRPLKILEVGCGTGSNIKMLQTFGTVDALEPNDAGRAFSSERTGLPVKGGFLPDGVDLPDAYYDLIVLFDVLEHIPDDRGALAKLREKLAPGGRLMLTVPAMPSLWSAHDVAHHHQRRYTAALLKSVLETAGFRLIHRTHFNTILFPLIVLARKAAALLGRQTNDDAMPGAAVNRVLEALFASERHLVGRSSLPVGISIAAVVEPTSS